MHPARAILVHALAVSLLWLGVCPCSGSNASCGSGALCGSGGSQVDNLAGCGTGSGCSTHKPGGKCCCCRSGEGGACGAVCRCATTDSSQPASPATPAHGESQDQHLGVCISADPAALLTAFDATALLRASLVAGYGYLPASTLQSQSVRIQT
jgi:hypothetical protein